MEQDGESILLHIIAKHEVRDMSVASRYEHDLFLQLDKIHEDMIIKDTNLGCGRIEVKSIADTMITLRWHNNDYSVAVNDEVATPQILFEEPHQSPHLVSLIISLSEKTHYQRVLDQIFEIREKHKINKSSFKNETIQEETQVLNSIDELIKEGEPQAYVMKALLSSCNDWYLFKIVRITCFQVLLLEGIEHGCLSPRNELSWEWLDIATYNNDPSTFMEDLLRFYDILSSAAENGNYVALDIRDRIWEPENIIEED